MAAAFTILTVALSENYSLSHCWKSKIYSDYIHGDVKATDDSQIHLCHQIKVMAMIAIIVNITVMFITNDLAEWLSICLVGLFI